MICRVKESRSIFHRPAFFFLATLSWPIRSEKRACRGLFKETKRPLALLGALYGKTNTFHESLILFITEWTSGRARWERVKWLRSGVAAALPDARETFKKYTSIITKTYTLAGIKVCSRNQFCLTTRIVTENERKMKFSISCCSF